MSRPVHFAAILFDCDGVLVDSEGITNRVLHRYLNEQGWPLSETECMQIFIGKMVRSETALIEKNIGKAITDDWMQAFYQKRNIALKAELTAIAGSKQAVQDAYQYTNGQLACASGADLDKINMQLEKAALSQYFKVVLSGHDCLRNKPYPDVYLAAAAALEAPIQNCLVIEDSITGITAGFSAGATVWAYCPENGHFNAQQLQEAGASLCFTHMSQLSMLLHSHY